MNEHLVNLLIEEYKQFYLSCELREKGIDIDMIIVNNISIVIDIVGFPRDSEKFCRDWLTHPHFNLITEFLTEHPVIKGRCSLELKYKDKEEDLRKKLREYVEWLYSEYIELKNDLDMEFPLDQIIAGP